MRYVQYRKLYYYDDLWLLLYPRIVKVKHSVTSLKHIVVEVPLSCCLNIMRVEKMESGIFVRQPLKIPR